MEFHKAFTSMEGKRRDFKWKHVPVRRTRRKSARVKQHSLRLPGGGHPPIREAIFLLIF
jgi:hypothetical protein